MVSKHYNPYRPDTDGSDVSGLFPSDPQNLQNPINVDVRQWSLMLYRSLCLAEFVKSNLILRPEKYQFADELGKHIGNIVKQSSSFFKIVNSQPTPPQTISFSSSELSHFKKSLDALRSYATRSLNAQTGRGNAIRVLNDGKRYNYLYDRDKLAFATKSALTNTLATLMVTAGVSILALATFTRFSEKILPRLFKLALQSKVIRYLSLQKGFFFVSIPIALSLIFLSIFILIKHHVLDKFSYNFPGSNPVSSDGIKHDTLPARMTSGILKLFLPISIIAPPVASYFVYKYSHSLSLAISVAAIILIAGLLLFALSFSTAKWVEFFTKTARLCGSAMSSQNLQVLINDELNGNSLFYDDLTQSVAVSRMKAVKITIHCLMFAIYFLTTIIGVALTTLISIPLECVPLTLTAKLMILLPFAAFCIIAGITGAFLHMKQWKDCDIVAPHTSNRLTTNCLGETKKRYTGCSAAYITVATLVVSSAIASISLMIIGFVKYMPSDVINFKLSLPLLISACAFIAIISLLTILPMTYVNKAADVIGGEMFGGDNLCCSHDVMTSCITPIRTLEINIFKQFKELNENQDIQNDRGSIDNPNLPQVNPTCSDGFFLPLAIINNACANNTECDRSCFGSLELM